jgi:arsenate reductase (glutaredoxin)
MSYILFGIKSCDTMKKARVWLDVHHIVYTFHDYKTVGIDEALLTRWCTQLGWECVLNKAGTTFRKLTDVDKQNLTQSKAIKLMLAQPSLIKRPILENKDMIILGFKPEKYESILA